MKIDDIFDEWEKDSVIDQFDLSGESIKTGKLHSKYSRMRSEHRLKAETLASKHRTLREFKKKYYRGDFNNPEDLAKYNLTPWQGPFSNIDVQAMIDGDQELADILLKKVYYEEVVTFCESVLKELHNRTYAIGSSIKWEIFQGGG